MVLSFQLGSCNDLIENNHVIHQNWLCNTSAIGTVSVYLEWIWVFLISSFFVWKALSFPKSLTQGKHNWEWVEKYNSLLTVLTYWFQARVTTTNVSKWISVMAMLNYYPNFMNSKYTKYTKKEYITYRKCKNCISSGTS